jgi:Cu/Ag efflux pump CusA
VARIRAAVDGYPGLHRDVQTYLQERVKEVLTGTSGAIVVRLFGPDLASLRGAGREVAGVTRAVPGVVDLKVEPQVLVPQIEVRLRPEAARRFGLTPGEVRRARATLCRAPAWARCTAAPQVLDVVVWGEPACAPTSPRCARCPSRPPRGARSRSATSPTSSSSRRPTWSSARAPRGAST